MSFRPWVSLWPWDCPRIREAALLTKKAGWEGVGKEKDPLLSMRSTVLIVGLAPKFAWTHNNPIWMHLPISILDPFLKQGSTISKAFPFPQLLHAYNNTNIWQSSFICIYSHRHSNELTLATYKADETFFDLLVGLSSIILLSTHYLQD